MQVPDRDPSVALITLHGKAKGPGIRSPDLACIEHPPAFVWVWFEGPVVVWVW